MIRNILITSAIASSLVFTPTSAVANNKKKIGGAILIGTILCAASKKCRDSVSGKKAKPGGKGKYKPKAPKPTDAVALSRDQKFQVQEGLNQLGYSTNGIDGVFGRGTRTAIRAYQRDRGFKVTGLLSAAQTTELISNSPAYATLSPNDDRMFEIEFARDVTREELAEIQRLLNLKGYDAGPVDGKLGRRTINAIAAYKRSISVGGPSVPTKRVLAKLEGRDLPAPGRFVPKEEREFAEKAPDGDQGACIVECEPADKEKVEKEEETIVASEVAVSLDLLGARTGMTETDIELVVSDSLETDVDVFGGSMSDFAGNEVLSSGLQLVDPNWPNLGSSMVTAYFDEGFPELGAFVIVRTISLGEEFGHDTVAESILPQFVDEYGADAKVGNKMIWVTDRAKLNAARKDPAEIAACGSLGTVARDMDALKKVSWPEGAGPKLDLAGFDAIAESCGDVLSISHTGHSVTLSLWNTDMLLAQKERLGVGAEKAEPAGALKIKF